VSEQYPYHESADGRVSAEASFSVSERYLRYEHVTADRDLLIEAGNNESITGTTSILPATELSATIVRDGDGDPSRTESELTIDSGNFSVDSGLADAAPGRRRATGCTGGSRCRTAGRSSSSRTPETPPACDWRTGRRRTSR